jgi:hypothetical protein
MKRPISKGKCQLCEATVSKTAMTRHLATCLQDQEAAGQASGKAAGQKTRLFHLVVEGKGRPEYWLHLEVPARATLRDLDDFLRHIWLECCDHMSAFDLEGTRYSVCLPKYDFFGIRSEDRDMQVPLEQVLHPGLKGSYEYDFGSTTMLTVKVLSERDGLRAQTDAVRLLARNEPPLIPCGSCGKPAAYVMVEEAWDPSGWLCAKCARKHRCDDEGSLPVVNSPRVGVCGYTGQ